ncbi:outer membrane lipoprotein carrier protein LolA [Shewanella avicenniae]|uniref:Outer membrane lipoprotein carrier protein LolA n=1 Tax=Shewanella avicenniae TaxID=2814294 RepID=A0ABX7QTB0_9GAMM|nr:outer membrane lipoprotein carrier protein LolA [Shewanella avicenniae]QSX33921.1 outer membrane lipoprotein carrier protein LolA [Shewanella avicenniae]
MSRCSRANSVVRQWLVERTTRLLHLGAMTYLLTGMLSALLFNMAVADDSPLIRTNADDFQALFSAPATQNELSQLMQSLALGNASRGEFQQTRWLKVLKRPLQSQGKFVFSAAQGLYWQQLKPFATTLILQQNSLTQIDSQGNRSQQATSAAPAELSQLMPQLMRALLSADIDFLQQHFSLHLQHPSDQSHWQLGLVAQDPQLMALLPHIVLSGDSELRRILLLGQQQDVSEIALFNVQQGTLTTAEQALFPPVGAQN